jgi:hypothetical protein
LLDEQPKGFENGGFLKTSQLHKCGFAFWYPLLSRLQFFKNLGLILLLQCFKINT